MVDGLFVTRCRAFAGLGRNWLSHSQVEFDPKSRGIAHKNQRNVGRHNDASDPDDMLVAKFSQDGKVIVIDTPLNPFESEEALPDSEPIGGLPVPASLSVRRASQSTTRTKRTSAGSES